MILALLCVQYASQVLNESAAMNVLLPEKSSPRPDGLWPTLYLLHGYMGDHTDWVRRTSIERYVAQMDIAVVMPQARNSFYTDVPNGCRYFEHISREVPELCEKMFRLSSKREDRFVAGLSMGGYGAFKMALRCPERFAAAMSLSGALDVMEGLRGDRHLRTYLPPFSGVFGAADDEEGGENDLLAVARGALQSGDTLPKLYMACGTEDFLYSANKRFLELFHEPLGIAYEEGPGAHSWAFWDAYIQRALAWLSATLPSEDAAQTPPRPAEKP